MPAQSAVVGQPLTLVLPVKDDGLPTPEIRARGTGGPRGERTPPDAPLPDPFAEAARGQFRVKWVQYRGAGKAKITPAESAVLGADGRPAPTDGKSRTKVTFDRPAPTRCAPTRWTADAYFVTQDVMYGNSRRPEIRLEHPY